MTTGRSRPPGPLTAAQLLQGHRRQPGPAGPPADVTGSVWAWKETPCLSPPTNCSLSVRPTGQTCVHRPLPQAEPPGFPSAVSPSLTPPRLVLKASSGAAHSRASGVWGRGGQSSETRGDSSLTRQGPSWGRGVVQGKAGQTDRPQGSPLSLRRGGFPSARVCVRSRTGWDLCASRAALPRCDLGQVTSPACASWGKIRIRVPTSEARGGINPANTAGTWQVQSVWTSTTGSMTNISLRDAASGLSGRGAVTLSVWASAVSSVKRAVVRPQGDPALIGP